MDAKQVKAHFDTVVAGEHAERQSLGLLVQDLQATVVGVEKNDLFVRIKPNLDKAVALERTISIQHQMHALILGDWIGDFTKERDARGGHLPPELDSLFSRMMQEAQRIQLIVKNVDEEFGRLSGSLTNLRADEPLPKNSAIFFKQNESLIARQILEWEKLDEDLEKLYTDANKIVLSMTGLASSELQNYQKAHQFFEDLVNSTGTFEGHPFNERKEIAERALRGDRAYFEKNFSKYFQSYDATQIFKDQSLVPQLKRLLAPRDSWLIDAPYIESSSAGDMRYDAAVTAAAEAGKRLMYPQEDFAIAKFALSTKDPVYIKIETDLRQRWHWMFVALKRSGDTMTLYWGAVLKWKGDHYDLLKEDSATEKGSYQEKKTFSVAGLKRRVFLKDANCPGELKNLWGNALDVAESKNAYIWIVGSDDNRVWPVARSLGNNDLRWCLFSNGNFVNYGSRWVGVRQKNFQ